MPIELQEKNTSTWIKISCQKQKQRQTAVEKKRIVQSYHLHTWSRSGYVAHILTVLEQISRTKLTPAISVCLGLISNAQRVQWILGEFSRAILLLLGQLYSSICISFPWEVMNQGHMLAQDLALPAISILPDLVTQILHPLST